MGGPAPASSGEGLPAIVGIVGAGTMGAGIGQVALEAGCEVVFYDVDEAAVEGGRERIRDGLTRRASKLGLDPDGLEAWVAERLDRIRQVPTVDGLADEADLVIESAAEDLALKRTIFRTLDDVAEADVILATNTSALSVAEIAEVTTRPDRVIGLHFFNPAPIMALVEVVAPPLADPGIVARAVATMTAWGKTPVVCADSPGFIVNRVNRPFTLEALALLADGRGTIESIDGAMRAAGFPIGPFELMDLTGVDVTLAASGGIFELSRASGDALAERFRPSPIQERLVASGRLGRKTGTGFYDYGSDGRPTGPASESVVAVTSGADMPPDRIVARITLAIINEAHRALGDRVATTADIDLAMRLGAGHTIGPFERAAVLGGPVAVREALREFASDGPRFEPAPALSTSD
jgi:3-hydroxybutyryl-CoA dehydrogenase